MTLVEQKSERLKNKKGGRFATNCLVNRKTNIGLPSFRKSKIFIITIYSMAAVGHIA